MKSKIHLYLTSNSAYLKYIHIYVYTYTHMGMINTDKYINMLYKILTMKKTYAFSIIYNI